MAPQMVPHQLGAHPDKDGAVRHPEEEGPGTKALLNKTPPPRQPGRWGDRSGSAIPPPFPLWRPFQLVGVGGGRAPGLRGRRLAGPQGGILSVTRNAVAGA